jgi:hypothetical protein
MNGKTILENPDGKFNTLSRDETYILRRIMSNPDALLTYLVSANNKHKIEAIFDGYIEYFRHTTKKDSLICADKKRLFSVVENSDIFIWLEKESCGTFSARKNEAKHFQINTENDVIDIVTYGFIKVNVLDNDPS